MLTPAPLSAECEAALAAFEKAGGVVLFFAYAFAAPVSGEELHQEATRLAHAALTGEQFTAAPTIERWLSVDEFLGKLNSSLGVFHEPASFLRKARAQTSYSLESSDGLLRAFTDPPYGLGLATPDEVGHCWAAITAELFHSFRGELEIARWSNNWSTFFAPGHEWWGALWWTVVNRDRGWIVVVAASSTD